MLDQLACQCSSANHLSYRIVSYDDVTLTKTTSRVRGNYALKWTPADEASVHYPSPASSISACHLQRAVSVTDALTEHRGFLHLCVKNISLISRPPNHAPSTVEVHRIDGSVSRHHQRDTKCSENPHKFWGPLTAVIMEMSKLRVGL